MYLCWFYSFIKHNLGQKKKKEVKLNVIKCVPYILKKVNWTQLTLILIIIFQNVQTYISFNIFNQTCLIQKSRISPWGYSIWPELTLPFHKTNYSFTKWSLCMRTNYFTKNKTVFPMLHTRREENILDSHFTRTNQTLKRYI